MKGAELSVCLGNAWRREGVEWRGSGQKEGVLGEVKPNHTIQDPSDPKARDTVENCKHAPESLSVNVVLSRNPTSPNLMPQFNLQQALIHVTLPRAQKHKNVCPVKL